MNEPLRLFVFSLDERFYALSLSAVERVVHTVEITPLPKAPEIVLGLINFQGTVVPVVNIRRRFRLPERNIELNDLMIVARTVNRRVALWVNSVSGIIECRDQEIIAPDRIVQGLEYIEGVVKTKEGILFIHNLDRFLSLEEEKTLNDALSSMG